MNAQVNSSNSVFDYLKWFVVVALVVLAIGGNYYFSAESLIYRVLGVIVLLALAVGIALTTGKGQSVARLRKEAWRSSQGRLAYAARNSTNNIDCNWFCVSGGLNSLGS